MISLLLKNTVKTVFKKNTHPTLVNNLFEIFIGQERKHLAPDDRRDPQAARTGENVRQK